MFTLENRNNKVKILLVFGTRPEAIKMCPVVQELYRRKNIETIVCVTGQHEEMLQQVLDIFKIHTEYNLAIMQSGQTLFDITELVMEGLKEVLEKERPQMVLVHGDTTTAYAAALSCFYMRIPIAHVEAGLRTYDMYSPYPEEFNRQAIDLITAIYFAPTELARQNLLQEGKPQERIFVTGNTVIDALKTTVKKNFDHEYLHWVGRHRFILMTVHRRENIGEPMRRIFQAVRKIAEDYEDVKILYPVHKNPKVRQIAERVFENIDNVRLVEPLDVLDFHNFMNKSYLIITDSGGIQEEAPSLGKPVIVVRDTTERPEGVKAGTLKLVGTEEQEIYDVVRGLLDSPELYQEMVKISNPYGDGDASGKVADVLEQINLWR